MIVDLLIEYFPGMHQSLKIWGGRWKGGAPALPAALFDPPKSGGAAAAPSLAASLQLLEQLIEM